MTTILCLQLVSCTTVHLQYIHANLILKLLWYFVVNQERMHSFDSALSPILARNPSDRYYQSFFYLICIQAFWDYDHSVIMFHYAFHLLHLLFWHHNLFKTIYLFHSSQTCLRKKQMHSLHLLCWGRCIQMHSLHLFCWDRCVSEEWSKFSQTKVELWDLNITVGHISGSLILGFAHLTRFDSKNPATAILFWRKSKRGQNCEILQKVGLMILGIWQTGAVWLTLWCAKY